MPGEQETSAEPEPTRASPVGETNTGEAVNDLEDILSKAAVRERESRKRAIVYTLLPIILGVVFLGVSLRKVSQLQQTATNLNTQIETQTNELNSRRAELDELDARKKEAERNLKVTTDALTDINAHPAQAQTKARQALNAVTNRTISAHAVTSKPVQGNAAPGTYTRVYSKGLSLKSLISHLQDDEANLSTHLVSLQAGPQGNVGSFQEVSSETVGHVILIEASNEAERARLLTQGKRLVFEDTVFVEGKRTRVAAFR